MSIELEAVSLQFTRGRSALLGISLRHGNGLLGLVGPKDSGKTTLLSIIAGLDRPTSGVVRVQGVDSRERLPVRPRVTLLPADAGLYPELTVAENLDALLEFMPESGLEPRAKRLERVLTELELAEWAHSRVGILPPGVHFRAVIAAARLHPDTLLLVEEPHAELTPEDRSRVRALLAQISRSVPVVLSSRFAEGFEAHTDQLAFLNRGLLCYAGSIRALLAGLQGRVWIFAIRPDDPPPAIAGFTRTGLERTAELTVVRGVADRPPTSGARPVAPALNDAYTWLLAGYEAPAGASEQVRS